MTRSEEQLRISTRTRPRERVRLVKHIVTETVTHTVEVRREELRVERERLPDETDLTVGLSNQVVGADDVVVPFDQDDLEIVLHEERVVVNVQVVPVELVRLRIHTKTGASVVEDTVHVEHVELDTAPTT